VQNLVMLTVAFFLLRALGQGALSLLSQNMLAMWFRQRLGTVSGIASVAVNLITAFIPVGVLAVIKQVGWRNAYLLAGAVVLALMLPLALLIFVNRPEDVGQQVDGDNIDIEKTNDHIPETSLDLKQAMRTRAYWIMVAVMISWAGIITAIIFNLLPIFTAKGLTEEEAAFTFTLLLIISAVGQLIGGYLADRIPLQWLAFSGLTLYTAGVLSLGLAPDTWVVLAYTTSVGLAQGFLNGLFSTIWPRYYGRKHLGKIRGSIWTVTVAGSSAGPFLMGLAFDRFGDFKISLLVSAAILGVLAIAGLWATPPQETIPA
jgi:sugar phosphate permease